jgi:DNA-binding NtrC family response regulator
MPELPLSRRLLVVDDDPDQVEIVRHVLEPEGLTVTGAGSGEQALTLVVTSHPDAVLLDYRLPGMSGLETLRAIRANGYDRPVVLVSGHASMETAADAMESGAEDFLTKPMDAMALRALARRMVNNEVGGDSILPDTAGDTTRELRLVGKSPQMVEVSKAIGQVARTDVPVLILGEPGTGKELVAYLIHQRSRRPGPLVTIDCTRTPRIHLERELMSRLAQASMGTLLVDDVDSMPLPLQHRLLEAIDTNQFTKLDGSERIHHSARIIVASSANLSQRTAAGDFRGDLYYRLAVVTIQLPPLRERGGDLRLLTDYFAHRLANRLNRRLTGLSEGVYQRLGEYSWPGNVRELRGIIERSLLSCSGHVLTTADLKDLPAPIFDGARPLALADYAKAGKMLEDVAWDYINQVLAETCGNQSEAARRLGIHRNTLRRMMQQREQAQ